MKLFISEPDPRESGAILVYDEDNNDIAYFFHNEHATVEQSYETALALAQKLVAQPEMTARDYVAAITQQPATGTASAADPWVDTRLLRFDDTIVFGHGGFDFDAWEALRWEMHTRHGSFAVWKSAKSGWSMYGGKYGVLALDRYASEAEARADAESYFLSLDNEVTPLEAA